MKVLLVMPEVRLNDKPTDIPFWAGILGAIAENKGAQVGILDLNAIRMNYGGGLVPDKIIEDDDLYYNGMYGYW